MVIRLVISGVLEMKLTNFKKDMLKSISTIITGFCMYFYLSLIIFITKGKYIAPSVMIRLLDKEGTFKECIMAYTLQCCGLCLIFVGVFSIILTLICNVLKKIMKQNDEVLNE